ncbi:hypothetical protein ACRALDRAFT_1069248 [Sodiomyces alcalophilus JCM 7366]|uniref:uncharacterized protein n=1 Tax=Sodiomyces alcalophilus JCM 7366 TaxID=591952 RepID=UPI0039B3930E
MGVFFISWELWQQMSFCLAAAIAVVFFIGYVKLCWTNRYLKRQEALDDEKRIRSSQMRKSGLSSRRDMEVPFGVRAIESGVTVDGIWICNTSVPFRTGNPNANFQPSATNSNSAAERGDGREETSLKGTIDDRPHGRPVSGSNSAVENQHSSNQAHQPPHVSAQSHSHTPRVYQPPPPRRMGHTRSNSWQESQPHVSGASSIDSRDGPDLRSSSRPRTSFSAGSRKLHKSPPRPT